MMKADSPAPRAFGQTARPILAGTIVGCDAIARSVAMTAFVFTGALTVGAPFAVVLFFIANAVSTAFLTAGRALPAPIFSSVQIAPVAILVPAIGLVGDAAGPVGVIVLLGLTAILTGVVMLTIAYLDLARLVRMLPYPVAAGFLASSGALLILAAIDLTTAGPVETVPNILLSGGADAVLPLLTVAFAGLLAVLARYFRNSGVVLGLLAGTLGLQLALPYLGLETAQALRLLYTEAPAPALSIVDGVAAARAAITPDLLLQIVPLMLVAALIGILGSMLNSSGIELLLNADLESRTVLNRIGLGNILIGLMGATTAYLSATHSATAARLSAAGRASAWAMVAICLLAAPFAGAVFLFVPTFVSGGLLLFSGVWIVHAWLIQQLGQLNRADWLLVLAMVSTTLTFGILAAVGLGVLAASVIFAVHYARVPVVRATTDMTQRRSTVDRGPAQTDYIEANGRAVAIVSLQGFLFFGTATRLGAHVRGLLSDAAVRSVVLDFHRVSQIDASAIAAIRRMDLIAQKSDARLVLAGMSGDITAELHRSGIPAAQSRIAIADTVDAALEAEEERLIARMDPAARDETALSALTRILGSGEDAAALLGMMTREVVEKGTRLIRQGDPGGDIFIIDRGRLSIRLRQPGGAVFRLRTMASGALIGEVASYAGLDRTADVVAESHAVVYRASADLAQALERDNPARAAALHRMVATTLAEKLDRTNKLLGASL